ncbi:MAG: photosynthetic complex assembly protein PuhC [Bradyrhizobium sp.]
MSAAVADRNVPRGALIGAAALISFAMVAAATGRVTGIGTVRGDYSAPSHTVALRFEDRSDGGISVIAPETGAVVGTVEAGTDGFIRTVLRSMAFDRQRRGIGSAPPFKIVTWPNGRSTIDDPSTGRRIDLAAFGVANMQTFTRLMTAVGDKP